MRTLTAAGLAEAMGTTSDEAGNRARCSRGATISSSCSTTRSPRAARRRYSIRSRIETNECVRAVQNVSASPLVGAGRRPGGAAPGGWRWPRSRRPAAERMAGLRPAHDRAHRGGRRRARFLRRARRHPAHGRPRRRPRAVERRPGDSRADRRRRRSRSGFAEGPRSAAPARSARPCALAAASTRCSATTNSCA